MLSTLFIGDGIPQLHREVGDEDRGSRDEAAPCDCAEGQAAMHLRSGRPVFDWRSAGLWIGLCEVALVFPLVNLSVAVLFALLAKRLVQAGGL